MKRKSILLTPDRIQRAILFFRGERVIIDADLAELYGVSTKVLNQAVHRNRERFPEDFMFRLTKIEKEEVVTKCDHLSRLRFSPVLPAAFTEHGALMVASLINTPMAIEMSVYVMRTFVKLRKVLMAHKEFSQKLKELEKINDVRFKMVFQAIRELQERARPKELPTPLVEPPKRRIGFHVEEREAVYGRNGQNKRSQK